MLLQFKCSEQSSRACAWPPEGRRNAGWWILLNESNGLKADGIAMQGLLCPPWAGLSCPTACSEPRPCKAVLPLVSSPGRTSHHIKAQHGRHPWEANDSHNGPHHLGWGTQTKSLSAVAGKDNQKKGGCRGSTEFLNFHGKIQKTSLTSFIQTFFPTE